MRVYERDPTGRSRSRGRSASYSKTDKPFAHKLKSALSWRSTRIIIGSLALLCSLGTLLLIVSPKSTTTGPKEAVVGSLPEIQDLIGEDDIAEELDPQSLDQLRSHRNELEKSMKGIDALLLRQKEAADLHAGVGAAEAVDRGVDGEGEAEGASKPSAESLPKSPEEIWLEIVSEFKWAWKCYKECAWGFDTVHPIACKGSNDAFDLGLAMIDALDTMIIMNSVVCHRISLSIFVLRFFWWILSENYFWFIFHGVAWLEVQ